MENISKKTPNVFWFKVWDFNISDIIHQISNYSLELYLPKLLGPCDLLPLFLIKVFQKKRLGKVAKKKSKCKLFSNWR